MPLTQIQLANAVADRADITRAEAKRVLAAFEEVVLEELGNAQKVRIGGIVQLTVRVKPAQKARKGRNPATGEEITIAKKPAGVDVRASAVQGQGRAAVDSEGPPPARGLRCAGHLARTRARTADDPNMTRRSARIARERDFRSVANPAARPSLLLCSVVGVGVLYVAR